MVIMAVSDTAYRIVDFIYILYYIYIRASLSLVALFTGSQPLYRGREGRPPRKTLIGSVHAVDSQALIIIFFDSRLSPARAARA